MDRKKKIGVEAFAGQRLYKRRVGLRGDHENGPREASVEQLLLDHLGGEIEIYSVPRERSSLLALPEYGDSSTTRSLRVCISPDLLSLRRSAPRPGGPMTAGTRNAAAPAGRRPACQLATFRILRWQRWKTWPCLVYRLASPHRPTRMAPILAQAVRDNMAKDGGLGKKFSSTAHPRQHRPRPGEPT